VSTVFMIFMDFFLNIKVKKATAVLIPAGS